MGEIPRILVGLAVGPTPDRRFFESLPLLVRDVEREKLAHLDLMWVWDKTLVDAQNDMAERMEAGDYDYLLTIEDDHHGFTEDMLKACLAYDAEVVAIPYRSRHFPFDKIPMTYHETTKNGTRMYTGAAWDSGYHQADLAGFGFTLIRRDVFQRLEKPTFRLNTGSFKGVGPRATDIDFCLRVQESGGKIVGCYDFTLPHRDIEDESYKKMLVEGVLTRHSMFTRLHSMIQDQRKLRQLEQVA